MNKKKVIFDNMTREYIVDFGRRAGARYTDCMGKDYWDLKNEISNLGGLLEQAREYRHEIIVKIDTLRDKIQDETAKILNAAKSDSAKLTETTEE